ncbi:hypothetical protein EsDP_00004655 [Epichloe bromicola]|uniref:Up-regulated during septation protein 1 domain-containing protein n=1 Tax=Epichloe bromicola TaxID=79588 RepID=A0ABQ0CSD5_9HYPO
MLPTDSKKYQLFPKDKPLPSLKINKTLDPEAAFEAAMNEKQASASSSRPRLNQHASARRRKVSVPDLEPMTTVQEVAMDSRRPPLHERSVSVPNNTRDERRRAPKLLKEMYTNRGTELSKSVERALAPNAKQYAAQQSQSQSRELSPLVIPTAEPIAPPLNSKNPGSKLRLDGSPTQSSRSARMDMSPMYRARTTPSSSTPDLVHPRSATTDGASTTTLPTPVSAPIMESLCASPNMWDSTSITSAQSDGGTLSAATPDKQGKAHIYLHRRGASETSTSIMDRGRSSKRVDARNNSGPLLKGDENNKRAMSSERRAFEELPRGWKPAEVSQKLSASDVSALQQQALEQAERFEVLRVGDVEALSKELRRLDERTDYLRRTYTSLRAGRRNLHSRICQHLRSPRGAKFSYESMLKQEEALAELHASIDDWVTKLEQAENRRTRVRQKLLEHVAAAAIIPGPHAVASMSGSLQQVVGIQSPSGPRELSTPPRSPSNSSFASRVGNASPSPQRVVAQVPSTILEQPIVEDAAEDGAAFGRATSTVASLKRGDVESIRIYAGGDVYALFADVENEISKMGAGTFPMPGPESVGANGVHEEDQGGCERELEREKQRQRLRSHEKLSGYSLAPSANPSSSRSTADMPVSPRTMPATTPATYSSGSTGPPAGPENTGAALNPVTFIDRDVKSITPSPLAPVASDTAKGVGPFLTSAVFKP